MRDWSVTAHRGRKAGFWRSPPQGDLPDRELALRGDLLAKTHMTDFGVDTLMLIKAQ